VRIDGIRNPSLYYVVLKNSAGVSGGYVSQTIDFGPYLVSHVLGRAGNVANLERTESNDT